MGNISCLRKVQPRKYFGSSLRPISHTSPITRCLIAHYIVLVTSVSRERQKCIDKINKCVALYI